jgi:hypothetical protein
MAVIMSNDHLLNVTLEPASAPDAKAVVYRSSSSLCAALLTVSNSYFQPSISIGIPHLPKPDALRALLKKEVGNPCKQDDLY